MTGTNVGDIASYSCDPHYELIGQYYRTCLDNGSWSEEDPSCAATGNMQFRFYLNLYEGHFEHLVSSPCIYSFFVGFVPILTHKNVVFFFFFFFFSWRRYQICLNPFLLRGLIDKLITHVNCVPGSKKMCQRGPTSTLTMLLIFFLFVSFLFYKLMRGGSIKIPQ